jgi:hypothetical protein
LPDLFGGRIVTKSSLRISCFLSATVVNFATLTRAFFGVEVFVPLATVDVAFFNFNLLVAFLDFVSVVSFFFEADTFFFDEADALAGVVFLTCNTFFGTDFLGLACMDFFVDTDLTTLLFGTVFNFDFVLAFPLGLLLL